ncbi:hypothetical protein CLV84_4013 [Neolewinella xylanilytica]|uniref:Dolichyl-phosphate-mannose-protein mannosyltransferase n=1 Tax=Neolewinella xylanilytica TaxID=1514080 RepID=A0A2S6I060_9BACT|nr:hypothetical protein [Neolewinella xylanilytica]PPK84244.1 hypothetical protein CLV84_4013 [Neolewinella xylanilytica]
MMGIGHRLAVLLFFTLLVLVGYNVLDDYGISWDESIQRRHGRVSLDYAAEKLGIEHETLEPNYDLEDYQWANYGMIYQILASLIELNMGVEDDPFVYYRIRHLINFGLYLLALGCFYRMLRLRWPERPWYPLLGTVMLTLSPRIFAHAFFNPKDHLLLVFYVIASFTLLRFLKVRSWSALLTHAFATALALNTRLPALIILFATVAILVWEQFTGGRKGYRELLMAASYPVVSLLLMIPFFPYLWEDTLSRLIGAFSEMSDFDWGGYNLLFGDRIAAVDVPAYYIPAWIVITTPVAYVLLSLTGGLQTLRHSWVAIRRGRLWKDFATQCYFTQSGLSIGPIVVVILLGSTLYNGWRHMHFVYPGLVYLALVGFAYWRRLYPPVAAAILTITLAVTAFDMVRYHPHQNVYFNYLIHGEPLVSRFDMDYWGVGYREALTRLANSVPEGETRTVNCANWPCQDNLLSLPQPLRGRLRSEGDENRADFLATNFINSDIEAAFRHEGRYANPVIEIKPAGILTMGIYRLKSAE